MKNFLARVLVTFALLGAVGTQAAIASEWCGKGYFRDGNGHCLYFGYESTQAPAHDSCPPDRHFDRGRCLLNR
jgi:hypothetical protein